MILLEFDSEGGVKGRRQYVLEDVAAWYTISAFGEEGAEVLRNVYRRAQILKKDWNINGSWDNDIIWAEREGIEEEESLKVIDEGSVKKAIEILNARIAIQYLASSKEVREVDTLHLTKEDGDRTLE